MISAERGTPKLWIRDLLEAWRGLSELPQQTNTFGPGAKRKAHEFQFGAPAFSVCTFQLMGIVVTMKDCPYAMIGMLHGVSLKT
jgi:hypothetical protein